MRTLFGVALGWCAAGLFCLGTTTAHANGRLPGATGLAIHPTDSQQLLLGLTYGLALSRNGGASWTWMCEQQIEGNGGDVDPAIVVTGDGTLVVLSLTNGGVLVSRDDGCSFERAMGPLQGHRGVDLTLDPTNARRVLALLSTIIDAVDGRPRYRNLLAHSLDHGASWQVLAEFPDDLSAETVEVAASDSNRIYVTGTASSDPLQGVVERSDDGGLSWKRTTVQLPRGSGSMFVSAIHPKDPDQLWVRVPGRGDIYGVLPARLWRSTDGGASFDQVGETAGGMLGFALSPDGTRVAFGGPLDGLFEAPSDASAAPSKISDLIVSCLSWRPNGFYACALETMTPYSLGFASEPTQRFVPLWHRADTCRDTCDSSSLLEMRCRAPWDEIAPMIDAGMPLCDGSGAMLDAGVDAGADAGSRIDDAGVSIVDASAVMPEPSEPARARSDGGCAVTRVRRTSSPWWLAPLLVFASWIRGSRRSARSARTDETRCR